MNATDFQRSVGRVMAEVAEDHRPVVVTRQGRPRLVVLPFADWEAYETYRGEWEERAYARFNRAISATEPVSGPVRDEPE